MSIFVQAEAVAELKEDKLSLVPSSLLDVSKCTDSALWRHILVAEQEVARRLGCPLEPTRIFPVTEPTAEELSVLGDKPYLVEPGYDMDGDFIGLWQFGTVQLRQRPVISVEEVRFVYPGINATVYNVPREWIYTDRKAGMIQFTAAPTATGVPASVLAMNAVIQGRSVPQMVRVKYTAGLTDKHPTYLDVRDVVLRMTVMRLLKDSFKPQSESISGDGFSQSQSFDASQHQDAIDGDLADIRQRIHGIVFGVV